MSVLGNRAKETSTSTGDVGNVNLDGPVAGYQSLVAAAAETSGDGSGPWSVAFFRVGGSDWECGTATLHDSSPDYLDSISIEDSSNGGSRVDWGVGTTNVFIAPTAAQLYALLGALSTTGLIERTGADAYAIVTVSAFIKTLLDDADEATARATIAAQEDVIAHRGAIAVGDGSGDASEFVVGAANQMVVSDGADPSWTSENQQFESAWPPYHISGFSMYGPIAAFEVGIGIGCARTHTDPGTTDNTKNAAASIAWTKKATNGGGTWVAGTGNNGLASSITPAALDWLACFVMTKAGSADVDFGFDSDLDANHLAGDAAVQAAGYNRFRFIGWVQMEDATPPTDILGFFYNPDSGLWQYLNAVMASDSLDDHTITLDIPEGDLDVYVKLSIEDTDANGVSIHHPSSTDTGQSGPEDHRNLVGTLGGGTTDSDSRVLCCNSSKQIHFDANNATIDAEVALWGFFVRRSDR